jgi:hypothetical protein
MARSHVASQLVKLGGDPVYREGVVTDNGNVILDVHNLQITNPAELEAQINAIVGVVTNGLFAARPRLGLRRSAAVAAAGSIAESPWATCALSASASGAGLWPNIAAVSPRQKSA